jgi:hypothetical protein
MYAQSTICKPLYPCTDVFDSYSSPVVPIVIANLCVVLHLAGAYALFSAPVFYLTETSVTKSAKLSNGSAIAFRVIWRTFYVALLGLLGALMPFFNAFVGEKEFEGHLRPTCILSTRPLQGWWEA